MVQWCRFCLDKLVGILVDSIQPVPGTLYWCTAAQLSPTAACLGFTSALELELELEVVVFGGLSLVQFASVGLSCCRALSFPFLTAAFSGRLPLLVGSSRPMHVLKWHFPPGSI